MIWFGGIVTVERERSVSRGVNWIGHVLHHRLQLHTSFYWKLLQTSEFEFFWIPLQQYYYRWGWNHVYFVLLNVHQKDKIINHSSQYAVYGIIFNGTIQSEEWMCDSWHLQMVFSIYWILFCFLQLLEEEKSAVMCSSDGCWCKWWSVEQKNILFNSWGNSVGVQAFIELSDSQPNK